MSHHLQHFLHIARAGKHPGCSSGELAARRLALCVLKESMILDGSAIAGLVEFIHLTGKRPTEASDLLH